MKVETALVVMSGSAGILIGLTIAAIQREIEARRNPPDR